MRGFFDFHKFAPDEILLYLRKSRADDPNMTVEEVLRKHEEILDEWAARNIEARIPENNRFREVVSGETIDDRPEIKRMLKAIESPRYKAVLIVEVQRLSRGDLEDAGRLIKLLRYSNTLVFTPERVYDLRDEYDREAFERELKRGNEYLEYTKKIMDRGKLLSVSQGNYIGSVAPYGYDRDTIKDGKKKCPTLKINEYEADIVRLVFDMYANQGVGAVGICNHLMAMGVKTNSGKKKWSPTIIFDMLENIHYLGKVRWNWRKTIKTISDQEIRETRPKAKIGEYLIYEGKHPAIISEELFQKASDIRGTKPKVKNDTSLKNPLAGMVKCGYCGYGVGMNTYVNKGVEYAPPKIRCLNKKHCKCGSVGLAEVLEQVETALRESIADFEIRIENQEENSVKLHHSLIAHLEKQMKELEAKELEQWELRSTGEMPKHIFDKLNEKVLTEKEEIKNALCTAYESIPDPVDYREKVKQFSDALDALIDPDVSGTLKNEFLKAVIDRVEYKRPPNVQAKNLSPERIKNERLKHEGNGWYSAPYELDIYLKE